MPLRLEAAQYLETQITGLSKPAQLRWGAAGEEIDVITKFKSSVRNREVSLSAEMICSRIARDLGLFTPTAYAVHISREFAESVAGFPGDLMRRSIGLNFGSEFLADYSVLEPNAPLPEALYNQAAQIFAFDVLIQNYDRQTSNPNLLFNSERLVLIDHESAFSPVLSMQEFGLDRLHYEVFYQHVLFPTLSKDATDYAPLTAKLEKLTKNKISAYIDALPDEWKQDGEAHRKIADYLNWMVAERKELCARIVELLG
jgi:hypothetical protein